MGEGKEGSECPPHPHLPSPSPTPWPKLTARSRDLRQEGQKSDKSTLTKDENFGKFSPFSF